MTGAVQELRTQAFVMALGQPVHPLEMSMQTPGAPSAVAQSASVAQATQSAAPLEQTAAFPTEVTQPQTSWFGLGPNWPHWAVGVVQMLKLAIGEQTPQPAWVQAWPLAQQPVDPQPNDPVGQTHAPLWHVPPWPQTAPFWTALHLCFLVHCWHSGQGVVLPHCFGFFLPERAAARPSPPTSAARPSAASLAAAERRVVAEPTRWAKPSNPSWSMSVPLRNRSEFDGAAICGGLIISRA